MMEGNFFYFKRAVFRGFKSKGTVTSAVDVNEKKCKIEYFAMYLHGKTVSKGTLALELDPCVAHHSRIWREFQKRMLIGKKYSCWNNSHSQTFAIKSFFQERIF